MDALELCARHGAITLQRTFHAVAALGSGRDVDHLLTLRDIDRLDRVLQHCHMVAVGLGLALQRLKRCLDPRIGVVRVLHPTMHGPEVVVPRRIRSSAWRSPAGVAGGLDRTTA